MMVRLGILGFAHGHVGMYCARWREQFADDIVVVGGWEHDPDRAAQARTNFQIDVTDSLEQFLARKDVDAVVIASETSRHAELAVAAANAGKAIILQKPMSLTLDDADRIIEAVRRTGVPFTMAWQMRVDPQNLRMKQLVEDGTLGRIVMLRRRHGLATHVWPDFDKTWHVNPALNRGMWADDAAHPIDFVHWMLGEPVSVIAEIDTLLNPQVPDDQGIAVFRYANGTFAEVCCSFTCVAGENTTEIVGEKGVIIQNYGDVPSCNVPRSPGAVGLKWFLHATGQWTESEIASPPGHGERIAGLAGPLLEFLQGKRPPIATAEEGRTSLKLTLACYDSSQRGERIRF